MLVIISIIRRVYLPPQTSIARRPIPSQLLAVPNALCQCQPLRLIRRRIRELVLRRCHDSKAPEGLIVIAFILRLVRWHIVRLRPNLEEQSLLDYVVVARIAGVVPVVYESAEHGACLPPIVGRRQYTGYLTGLVAGVPSHHAMRDTGGGGRDGGGIAQIELDRGGAAEDKGGGKREHASEAHRGWWTPDTRKLR